MNKEIFYLEYNDVWNDYVISEVRSLVMCSYGAKKYFDIDCQYIDKIKVTVSDEPIAGSITLHAGIGKHWFIEYNGVIGRVYMYDHVRKVLLKLMKKWAKWGIPLEVVYIFAEPA